MLRAIREPRAHGEDGRPRADRLLRRVRDERQHLIEIFGALEDIHLVHDDDDLLAPFADGRDERALRFGERPIRRRDEEDDVRARHELRREPLVLAQDRVRPGRVDDVDVFEEADGRGHEAHAVARGFVGRGRAVPHEMNPRRRRRDAFFEQAVAEQRVDERALARVELADDDQEKQFVELPRRLRERGGIGGRRGRRRELDANVGEQPAGRRQLRFHPVVQHAIRHAAILASLVVSGFSRAPTTAVVSGFSRT